jgi:hypothetical protein
MQTIEVPFKLSLKRWLRDKESNLHLRVQSPMCCRLHHSAKSRHGEGEMRGVGLLTKIKNGSVYHLQVLVVHDL